MLWRVIMSHYLLLTRWCHSKWHTSLVDLQVFRRGVIVSHDHLFNNLVFTAKKRQHRTLLSLCERNPTVTGGFPSQSGHCFYAMASSCNGENKLIYTSSKSCATSKIWLNQVTAYTLWNPASCMAICNMNIQYPFSDETRRVPTTRAISVLCNDEKWKYTFIFHKLNSSWQYFIMMHLGIPVEACWSWCMQLKDLGWPVSTYSLSITQLFSRHIVFHMYHVFSSTRQNFRKAWLIIS